VHHGVLFLDEFTEFRRDESGTAGGAGRSADATRPLSFRGRKVGGVVEPPTSPRSTRFSLRRSRDKAASDRAKELVGKTIRSGEEARSWGVDGLRNRRGRVPRLLTNSTLEEIDHQRVKRTSVVKVVSRSLEVIASE
jgi:hypothetical protein